LKQKREGDQTNVFPVLRRRKHSLRKSPRSLKMKKAKNQKKLSARKDRYTNNTGGGGEKETKKATGGKEGPPWAEGEGMGSWASKGPLP